MKKNKKKNRHIGPVSTILGMILFVSVLSFVLNKLGVEGYITTISNGVMEAHLETVNNVLSISGFKYFLGNIITNFKNFEPLFSIIIMLVGISICEKSGLFRDIFSRMKKFKYGFVLFITLFIGILASLIGDYSFVVLLPIVGIMYQYIGKNPIVGLLVSYIGLTLGYGVGILANYNDYSLGILTQAAANVDVDPNFKFSISSTFIINLVSTFLISIISYFAISKFLIVKFPKKYQDEEEIATSDKALVGSLIALVLSLLVLFYFIIDIKLFGAGMLLDKSQPVYIAKLFSDSAPFKQGIVIIISFIFMVCGAVYGKISKNIKNSSEYNLSLSKSFEKLGLLFVLMFFMSQFVSILQWSNIGAVLCSKLLEFMSSFTFSGVFLIIIFFIVVVLISILIPDVTAKWALMAPTVVPLFMRANISPAFTQFIFQIADSVGKIVSPSFIYFIILLAYLEKYRIDEKRQTTFFGTLKQLLPSISIIILAWLIIVCLWYVAGFPIGIGVNSVL